MSPYKRYNKRPYNYERLWNKWPWLAPGAQGANHPSASVILTHDKHAALNEAIMNLDEGELA